MMCMALFHFQFLGSRVFNDRKKCPKSGCVLWLLIDKIHCCGGRYHSALVVSYVCVCVSFWIIKEVCYCFHLLLYDIFGEVS